VGEATVTFKTQIDVTGPGSRASGNMTVDVWITSERKGPSDMSVAKLGSPVLVAKRVHPRGGRAPDKCDGGQNNHDFMKYGTSCFRWTRTFGTVENRDVQLNGTESL
jgi:hypothetical protein